MDLLKALKAPVQVNNWVAKMLIGGILLCVPIANFIVMGYVVKYVKKLTDGQDGIPEYCDLGELFVSGAKLFVGSIVYALPFVIITLVISLLLSEAGFVVTLINYAIEAAALILALPMIANFCVDEKILSMVNFPRMIKFLQDNTSNFVSMILYTIIVYIIYVVLVYICYLLFLTVLLLPFVMYAMVLSLYNIIGQFAQTAPKLEEIKTEAVQDT